MLRMKLSPTHSGGGLRNRCVDWPRLTVLQIHVITALIDNEDRWQILSVRYAWSIQPQQVHACSAYKFVS